MIQLCLTEPMWNDDGDADTTKYIISTFNKLEYVIWSFITSEARSEARLWLCNSLSGIRSIAACQQLKLFMDLLKSRPRKWALAEQLLQMIFEKWPQKVGPVIAKKSYMLENFFRGNPRRILQWFGNFFIGGEFEHRKGAKALAQFAFVNRDICWEELEWKGKHGQSPAMVATKPHYFLDLDVQQTVENFLENVPEFWSSDELAQSLKDGEILLTDTQFFVDYFIDLMYKDNSEEVWELINGFLMEEPFSFLCQRLLIVLEERDFCAFLGLIHKYLNPTIEFKDFFHASGWLEFVLSDSKSNICESIDELLLLNAVINQGRQLLRLACEEDEQEQKERIGDLASQIFTALSISNHWTLIMKQCLRKKALEAVKWLGLWSWVLHYKLSEECKTPESWETLFLKNDISFRKSSNYPLLHFDGYSEESGSEFHARGSISARKKKKGKSRKRRRKYDKDENNDSEFIGVDMSNDLEGLRSETGSWFLSIDKYSSSWSSVDLPEHLSKHCFYTWMKWVLSKWHFQD